MENKDDPGKAYDKSIRKRLTRTVLIPSVTLLVLWAVLATAFFINGLYVRLVAVSVREVSIPAVTTLSSLQQERQLALQYLDSPGGGSQQLQQQQQDTDGKLKGLQEAFASTISSAPDEIASKVTALKAQLDQLPVLRSQVTFRSINRAQVNGYYNGVLDSAATLFDTQARIVPDATAVQGAISATSVFRASDMMSRETSLVSSAFAGGAFAPDDFVQFTQLSGYYRTQLAQIAPFLEPAVRKQYQQLVESDGWKRLSAAEDAIVKHGAWTSGDQGTVPVSVNDWHTLTAQVANGLNQLTIGQADQVSAAAIDAGNEQLRNAILGSIVALLASLAAIIVAVRVSRSLVDRTLMTRLERLRNDSLDLARNRLPNIVGRLKNGEPVDVAAELPQLDHGRDEIGQVAEAFNTAQLTAVNAAASEAKARSGVHNVFLGIAHRNQVLVHRQLQILDEMEAREENSTQLASLFQLDHLAARARRTTENLIILGGKQPGRRWRKPVSLMEVLRAAVSETEQYSRVQVEQVPDVAIVGSAVADAIHLIAELVDNATSFSPPGSQVEVTSRMVARGVVVDVSDQGLGMKEAVRDWANAMMADAPEFDAMALRADSSLGLFVVARLASRLGVTVTFDPSRYGGTRATVLIPSHHLADPAAPEPAEDAPVLAPVGAPMVMEAAPARIVRPVPDQQQAATPRPYPARPLPSPSPREPEHHSGDLHIPAVPAAAPEPDLSTLQGDERPRLPRRQPQQNLVAQLQDETGAEDVDLTGVGETTARTLMAFHKGTRRARGGQDDS
ncbi:sensor histidine kinase [Amycolatopsis jejuensis]|uniref:sensor histidine kinase n=1 Tax=Amycolatopsis jejuensis TaxID=330084 RepID=UPI000526C43F|nr:nitrate- and nitrite sensing domain-containing protein [Amycolatopsis jejuensis]